MDIDNEKRDIGEYVQCERENQNVLPDELEAFTGISLPLLRMFECGKIVLPGEKIAALLCGIEQLAYLGKDKNSQ